MKDIWESRCSASRCKCTSKRETLKENTRQQVLKIKQSLVASKPLGLYRGAIHLIKLSLTVQSVNSSSHRCSFQRSFSGHVEKRRHYATSCALSSSTFTGCSVWSTQWREVFAVLLAQQVVQRIALVHHSITRGLHCNSIICPPVDKSTLIAADYWPISIKSSCHSTLLNSTWTVLILLKNQFCQSVLRSWKGNLCMRGLPAQNSPQHSIFRFCNNQSACFIWNIE